MIGEGAAGTDAAMHRAMSIGEVAERTGVTVSAVRYYDELGIVSAVSRTGGKRRFDSEAVGRINFVRRAQEFGFSLEDIQRMLDDSSGDWHELVTQKHAELVAQRTRLDLLIGIIDELQDCGCSVVTQCPIWTEEAAAPISVLSSS